MGNAYSNISARGDEPWVSVSDLGEFAFCARAGKLAVERQLEDTGEEYEPRAIVRSIYSIPQLEREIKLRRKILGGHAGFSAGIILGTWFFGLFAVGAAVIGYVVLAKTKPDLGAFHSFAQLERAKLDLRRAKQAIARVPHINHARPERVDWWAVLQAGFESTRPMDLLRDQELRICGKPWRVLRYGSYRIPVFRKKIRRENQEKDERLYHQHYVRVAAYCRLLEATEGGNSPFGIVMFGPTYDGVTVPLSNDMRERLKGSIVGLRALVKNKTDPPAPNTKAVCRNCPNGRPDSTYSQSDCGNRFNWLPPHEDLAQIKHRRL